MVLKMGRTQSECEAKTVEELKNLCTRLGLPQPIGDIMEQNYIDSCCLPNVLAFGNVVNKGKVSTIKGNSNMMRYQTKGKRGNNIEYYAKCESGLWGEKSVKTRGKIFGNFVGQNCKVLRCVDDKCDKMQRDAVTVKKMIKGYSINIGSSLGTVKQRFDSL